MIFILPGGFEPPSPDPKSCMIDPYTTGVRRFSSIFVFGEYRDLGVWILEDTISWFSKIMPLTKVFTSKPQNGIKMIVPDSFQTVRCFENQVNQREHTVEKIIHLIT